MHSYQHHIKDFNNATRHLTRVERMLYREAIELYYETEKPLPANDFDRLARRLMAITDEEKTALATILDEFFELTGDVYSHNRCDEEIEKYHSMQTAKAIAGKASAEAKRIKRDARKEERKQQNSTGVEQVFSVCSTEPQQNSTNQKPETTNQKPETRNHNIMHVDIKSPCDKIPKSKTKKPDKPITQDTWIAYSQAYFDRHGAEPVRNATINGQLAQFVKRIGKDEAPHVARFYVQHNNQYYTQRMHPVNAMLADAEKLRTEWATNRTMTYTQARQFDKTQARGDVFKKLIEECDNEQAID